MKHWTRVNSIHFTRVSSKVDLENNICVDRTAFKNTLKMIDLPKTDFVLAEEINNKGILTLNRPEILNAGCFEMVEKIFVAINNWQHTKSMIIIKGNGKAFSAGSDLKKLLDPSQFDTSLKFLKVEYTVNFMISNLKIPYVSLIDGIIMGGGVGYSIHGKYRVATERTVFAMPETIIGAAPDIAASYFFPRLQGRLGYYLGLTGSRLNGEFHCVYDHFEVFSEDDLNSTNFRN